MIILALTRKSHYNNPLTRCWLVLIPCYRRQEANSKATSAPSLPPVRSSSPSSPDGLAVAGRGGDVDLAGWSSVQ